MRPLNTSSAIIIVIILALGALGGGDQTSAAPLTVNNPSFEDDVLPNVRDFTSGLLSDWTLTPGAFQGVYRASAFEYNGGDPQGAPTDPAVDLPDGVNVAFSGGGALSRAISQTLAAPLTANTRYTLEVEVGNRLDGSFPTSYALQFLAGGSVLSSTCFFTPPPLGQFETATATFVAPSDHPQLGEPVEIRLVDNGSGQINYDLVRIDATAVPPRPRSFPISSSMAILIRRMSVVSFKPLTTRLPALGGRSSLMGHPIPPPRPALPAST